MDTLNYSFVIDCSVTMALLFLDEKKSEVKKVESLLIDNQAFVPTIWRYEVGNVLCMAERSKRIQEADMIELKAILLSLPIITDEISTTKTLENTLHLAREYKLTVYDAAYLELAMREGMPLATFDKQLKSAAKRAGTELV